MIFDIPNATPDDQSMVDTVRRFAQNELAPKASIIDDTSIFVHEQLGRLAELGVMGANIPEHLGGVALSAFALFGVVEAVAEACGSTVSALTAHFLATDSILLGGTDAQRAYYLPDAATGKTLCAFGLTEPTAGSDPADMRTRAVKTSTGWTLTGTKCFISNGSEADVIVVYAVTDPDAGHRGISAFLVSKNTPGLSVGKPERTMGLKGGHVVTLTFACELPEDALLGGTLGKGFKTAMQVLDNGRIEVAAMCCGLAGAALQAAIVYAKQRVIGGEGLSNKQGVRWQLADMLTDFAGARGLALEAARQREAAHTNGKRFSLAASQAKLACSEMAFRVTDAALQIHGGYGYTRDFPLERYVRDVRVMRIYEGSSEIQRNIIAALMLQ